MPRQGSLFPEIDREIRDDRVAAHRERVQQARAWLRGKNLSWLINHLLEHGPQTEHALMSVLIDEAPSLGDLATQGMATLNAVYALWLTKKLWRQEVGIHPGSGEMSYIYGIRRVHPVPAN